MKNFHQILQIVFLAYFGAFLIFFIAFDTLGGLFGMDEITSDSVVKIMLTGLIIFLLSWAIGYSEGRKMAASIKKMGNEMNALKAKIYDFEHPALGSKSTEPAKKGKDPDPINLPPRQNIT
ncbi:MAG: hypothetical protein ACI9UV_002222 [Algoriphagus sp.]|jgi:hypothetical protein